MAICYYFYLIPSFTKAFPETLPDKAAAVEKSQKGKPKRSNDLMEMRKATKTKKRSDSDVNEEIIVTQENDVMTPQDTIPVGVSFIDSHNPSVEKTASDSASDADSEGGVQGTGSGSDGVTFITDRRGIAFKRLQNIFDPYVTGLVVRP